MGTEAPKDIATVAPGAGATPGDSPIRRGAAFVPLVVAALVLAFAGAVSVAFGQDANWDLRNYHLYAPWAFVTGRLDVDLAVAGLATYVNPLLDLPYFALHDRMPPRVLAFAMGAVQGVAALVVYRIARLTLPDDRGRGSAAFVAAAGCCGSTFVSEFGNTMGDNATATLMLGALAAALARIRSGRQDARGGGWIAIGVVAGIGCGLKLTNATLALGLLAAVASVGGPWRRNASRIVACAAGAAIGFAASYGWWFVAMWRRFHNPFFPQFNAWFGGPLASATVVADDKWAPGGTIEAALFPLSFTAFPMRIHEIPLVDALWPVVYVAAVVAVVPVIVEGVAGRRFATAERSARQRAVQACFSFAAVGYGAWMAVFSIGRYLVGVELLLPLLAWLLVHRFVRGRHAATIAAALIVAASAFQVATARTWGNADFAEAADRVDVPAIDEPARATVLVMAAPVAWMFRRFPPELAYVGLDIRFPESVAYRARVDATIRSRGGPVYAILPADEDRTLRANSRLDALLARFGIEDGDPACRYVTAIFANMPGGDLVRDDDRGAQPRACRFRRDPTKSAPFDRDARAIAASAARRGFPIVLERCTMHGAAIGATTYRYRFCPVGPTVASDR